MTTARSSRNFGIDCLRGLAILLVIIHHLALPFRLPLGLLLLWAPTHGLARATARFSTSST